MKNNKIISGIYKITNPKGLVYIGKSINIYKRWYFYKKYRCKTQPKIYNSLKKYGSENHIYEIIHYCEKSKLDYLEDYYIDLYQSTKNKIGLNCNKTTESKLKSYQLKYNEKRKYNEKLEKKRKYNREYHRLKREEYKKELPNPSVEFLIKIHQIKTPFSYGIFMLDFIPEKQIIRPEEFTPF